MIEEMVSMVQAQSYEQILFITGFGLFIVLSIVGTVFALTRES